MPSTSKLLSNGTVLSSKTTLISPVILFVVGSNFSFEFEFNICAVMESSINCWPCDPNFST